MARPRRYVPPLKAFSNYFVHSRPYWKSRGILFGLENGHPVYISLLVVFRSTRRDRRRLRTSASGCAMTLAAAPTTCTASTVIWRRLEPSPSVVSCKLKCSILQECCRVHVTDIPVLSLVMEYAGVVTCKGVEVITFSACKSFEMDATINDLNWYCSRLWMLKCC